MKTKNKKSIDLKTHQRTINVLPRLGISEPTLYKDIKFLEIEIIKDNDNCSWISNEDVNKLFLLRKWIKIKKRRIGFDPEIAESLVIDEEDNLENITTPSTEVATEDNLENTTTPSTEVATGDNLETTITESTELTTTESTELATTESTELTTTETINITTNDVEEIYVEKDKETTNFYRDLMIRAGAKLKAKELAIPHLITRAIADEFTEETLPSDLKQKVRLAREAANPKFTPQQIAKSLLADYRKKLVGAKRTAKPVQSPTIRKYIIDRKL